MMSGNVMGINLHRPNEISTQEQVPVKVRLRTSLGLYATVYCNSMYVVGLGDNRDEIWKYNMDSGWVKCASLVGRRLYPNAGFIDQVLYICGGFGEHVKAVNIVEAFNAVTNECQTVGQLLHGVWASGNNCLPFRSLLYIFGG